MLVSEDNNAEKSLQSLIIINIDLYDFYMHGDIHALEKANKVKKADVWFVLNGRAPSVPDAYSLVTKLTAVSRFFNGSSNYRR